MKITKYNNVKNISGNKLKELRKSAQMSQQDLAEKMQLEGIDLTSKEISKIENLRTFFEFLYTIKHRLFAHPFQKINTEKRSAKQLPNYLSYEEPKKMTELYKNSNNELDIRKNAIIHLCLYCEMRISEVANLNISDFKLSERKF